ncbi:MAG: IS630 family transposase [Verrucomicrobiae bacterium]|nr:IS630 family transposase [Verrucomicrobiae bacterium]
MARPIRPLVLSESQRQSLQTTVKSPTASQREVLRSRIILCAAQGLSQGQVAQQCGVGRRIAGKWIGRFAKQGMAGLKDASGRGRKPSIPEEKLAEVLTRATRPPPGFRRWSLRRMARASGISVGSVHALWRAHGVKPHLTRTFKVSNDPNFEQKFWDVIGLYLNPPDKALVLCCDEKSQCQALERTQPGLPLGLGQIRTRTHDYIRQGTLTLFAALNYLDGKVLTQTAARHTHRQWLEFLRHLDRQAPSDLTLHLILDNYATHKTPAVRRWIQSRNRQQQRLHQRDRLVLHFTPTSSSWMNLVERFFRDLTEDTLREGSFTSVVELQREIEAYLLQHNLQPKRYVWSKSGEEILAKIARAKAALEKQSALP